MMMNSFKGSEDSRGEHDHLVNFIDGMLDEIHPSVSSEFCIYWVPQNIRKINEEAYDPRVISIGPFHHGDERFKSMEAFKRRYLKKVIRRNTRVSLKNYIEFLKDREASVRQCYSEIIEMGSDEFVAMLFVDGCFIIELLLCLYYMQFRDVDHSILTARRLFEDITLDLILLENQIPFFVLEGLFNLATTDFQLDPLLKLTISFFNYYNVQNKTPDDVDSMKHFTDLILILHRPLKSPRIVKKFQSTTVATELNEAGVKFKIGSSKCLLDVKFSNGVLEIPHIRLVDRTESLIRNLIALEVCHYPDDSHIIDYFIFMDYLINTPKDVDLLVQSGIIDNWLGDSKKAADLFNNLNKNITFSDSNFYFASLCEELNAFRTVRWHKWRATLKRNYFSSPWITASTSAAILLIALTIIQAVCSVIGVRKAK